VTAETFGAWAETFMEKLRSQEEAEATE